VGASLHGIEFSWMHNSQESLERSNAQRGRVNAKSISGEVSSIWFSDVDVEVRYYIALLRIRYPAVVRPQRRLRRRPNN
jgi:hypothetical protein